MSDTNGAPFADPDDYKGFFSPLQNTKPYVKWAFEGFQGSGKTYTMTMLAIWLHKHIGSKKPLAYVDNEESAKFFIKDFANAGIEVLHKPTNSMADVVAIMKMMREGKIADILLIDSITKVWEDFLKAFQSTKSHNKHRLDLQDWSPINATWAESFSVPMILDPYHILFAGRAGYEYEDELDERSGDHKSYKAGVKMRAARDVAYEPDCLVRMSRHEETIGNRSKKKVYREATVVKDRSRLIDGKTFRNPKPEDFAPAIIASLAHPVVRTRPVEGDAGMLFASEEDRSKWLRQRDIEIENLETELVAAWPGQTATEKQQKILALKEAFGVASWTWIKTQKPEAIAAGKDKVVAFIAAAKAAEQAAIDAQGPPKKNGAGNGAAPVEGAPGNGTAPAASDDPARKSRRPTAA